MSNYNYPFYKIDITSKMVEECCDIAIKLLQEVGIVIRHEKFLNSIKGKEGIKISGERVYLDKKLVEKRIEKFISDNRKRLLEIKGNPKDKSIKDTKWIITSGAFSMCVIDIETEKIRDATCQDLRELIKLKDSYGISGYYTVMPQDLPAIMQAIACYKICWETSDKTEPYDYHQPEQTKYIYEMCKVMEKPFPVVLNISQVMTISEHDIEVFLNYYPDWKKDKKCIAFAGIADYPMLGVTKPITSTGCIAMTLTHGLGFNILFNLFDDELEIPFGMAGGLPVDLKHTCWAYGHPRSHLYLYINSIIIPKLCGVEMDNYTPYIARLASSSCSIDEQSALEKMGVAMVAALQGSKHFISLGNLCVDDLFSGVQFVIDVEIVNYIKEVIESFNPHSDIISMDGIYEMLKDVCLGKEEFLSHPDTVTKFRNILPSSDLLHREKLRSWLSYKKTLKDRAKEECLRRIRETKQGFHLPDEKQKALDKIYKRAEEKLLF